MGLLGQEIWSMNLIAKPTWLASFIIIFFHYKITNSNHLITLNLIFIRILSPFHAFGSRSNRHHRLVCVSPADKTPSNQGVSAMPLVVVWWFLSMCFSAVLDRNFGSKEHLTHRCSFYIYYSLSFKSLQSTIRLLYDPR